MKGCMGCFAFFVLLASLGAAIQGVAFVWVHYWPPIVGLSLSWLAMRYIKVFSTYREEE